MDSGQVRENLEGTGQGDGFLETVKLQFAQTDDGGGDASLAWEPSKPDGLPQDPRGEPGQDAPQGLFSLDLDDPPEGGREEEDSASVELDPNFTWNPSESSPTDAGVETDAQVEPPAEAPGEALQQKTPFYSGRVFLTAFLALALALGSAVALYWKSTNTPKPGRQVVLNTRGVRHPVPVPLHGRSLEFLFLSVSQQGRDLLSLGVDLELEGNESRDFYTLNELFFRETIYAFLMRQKPSQNTYRSWQSILEKDLPEHLGNTMPQCRIRTFTIVKLERL
jgi:hypothetical protein